MPCNARRRLPDDTYKELQTFANVIAIVQKNYVEPVRTKDLIDGAITGMLASLDPHSAYLTPDLYHDLEVETRGSFGGLGIEITVKNDILTVVAPIEGTPANKAGIKSGRSDHQNRQRFHQGHDPDRRGQADARAQGQQDPPDAPS